MEKFQVKILTAFKIAHSWILKPHISGKTLHVTSTLLSPICKPFFQGKELKMKRRLNPNYQTKGARSLQGMARKIQWWRLRCSPANINEFFFFFGNCRGLGNQHTKKELEVVIREKDPSAVFLAETQANEARLKEIKRNLDFKILFFVERNNRGGGLALYQRNSIVLTVETFSKNHIDAINNKGKEDTWRLTGFYNEPMTYKQLESWNMLCQLNNRFSLPWLCAGDFNELLKSSEKLGDDNRSQTQMQLSRVCWATIHLAKILCKWTLNLGQT